MATKRDYFIAALKAGLYCKRAWVFSVFSMTKDEKGAHYPLQVVRGEKQYHFRDAANMNELILIEDSDVTKPLLNHLERLQFAYGDVPNVAPVKTYSESTYGNVFFNYVALIYAFGNKIPFQFGRVGTKQIETIIAERLESDPAEGEALDPNKIYVHEYVKYADAMFYLCGFTQLWVPGATIKSMTPPPDIKEFRQKLIDQYKDQLHDPAIVAKIEAELVKHDAEYLKGDPSEGVLFNAKSRNIVRKKLFLMFGAEAALDDKVEVDPIISSLAEGWEVDKFPQMNTFVRAGSFGRGQQTMMGGESVKWLLRASSNLGIPKDDCNTRLGVPILVTEANMHNLIGRYAVSEKGSVSISADNIKSLLGKRLAIRSPMFCKLHETDLCSKCVGDKLANYPTGLSIAVADYGSSFLNIFMQAVHGKVMATKKLDFKSKFF